MAALLLDSIGDLGAFSFHETKNVISGEGGELTAAFLWAQLQEAERITAERMASWDHYHGLLEPLERKGLLRRPIVPADCQHNAHMYYVLIAPEIDRHAVIEALKREENYSVFHYVPLHSSPAGRRWWGGCDC
ncbi:MAG: hypothetical protein EPN46_03655 [Candidimonas sp.]|nr:MAG: hypothetical protein EPN77_10905 [Candidimonas sp.]TAM24837.1 MAG: hypothetical protein EPN62_05605 [Candidimonas sp.]TAM79345.1 MAG: hypothetical protein EPN46_03655 [Candidimonas sp.]